VPADLLADRLALADLAASYARAVDRRDYGALAALFEPDGRIVVEREGRPPDVLAGPEAIAARVAAGIERFARTFHFVGQQLVDIDGDDASGETYCVAQHLSEGGFVQSNHVMNIRYQDRFRRSAAGWRFVERRLHVDWVEDRPVGTSG
jgi:SnoaL-like domain